MFDQALKRSVKFQIGFLKAKCNIKTHFNNLRKNETELENDLLKQIKVIK